MRSQRILRISAKEAASSLAAASAAQVEAERQAADLQVKLDAQHEESRQERNRLNRENERLTKQAPAVGVGARGGAQGRGGEDSRAVRPLIS